MLAYVFLFLAATSTQVGQEPEPKPLPPKYVSKDEWSKVICWDGSTVANAVECPPPMPNDKSQPAKPKANPGGWATTSDYPARALVAMQEGTTGFRLTIGPDGRGTNCEVTSSSGVAELDEATCSNVLRRARFQPAMDKQGNPTVGQYSNRITWRIPRGGSTVSSVIVGQSFPRPAQLADKWLNVLEADYPATALAERHQGRSSIIVDIDKTGSVTGCGIADTSGHVDLDGKACSLARTWTYEPALDASGAAVAGKSAHTISWRVPPQPTDIGTASRGYTSPVFRPGSVTISFTIRADGTVANCKSESTGKFTPTEMDEKGCYTMAKLFAGDAQSTAEPKIDRNVRYSVSLAVDPPFAEVAPKNQPSKPASANSPSADSADKTGK